tara:strand:- start:637 stop:897 length:261 start_codon:yes stop_codon:yes gene_type:complete
LTVGLIAGIAALAIGYKGSSVKNVGCVMISGRITNPKIADKDFALVGYAVLKESRATSLSGDYETDVREGCDVEPFSVLIQFSSKK